MSGATQQMHPYSLGWLSVWIAVATLLYLLIDTYLSTRTFRGVFSTFAFYLLWAVFVVFGLLAYGALQVSAADKIAAAVGHLQLAQILQILLAVGGALTFLQSFTLKISDFKPVDLGKFVDTYRVRVFEAIGDQVVKLNRRRDLGLVAKLSARYATTEQTLRDELSTVLSLAGRDAAAITRELQEIETRCRASSTDVARGLAERLVLMNNDRASQLLEQD